MHISPVLSTHVLKKPLFYNKPVVLLQKSLLPGAASENRTRACSLARSRPTTKLWPQNHMLQ